VRNAILQALKKGELVLPVGMGSQQLVNLLNKLGRKKWNVHIREKYSHADGVLVYLARYLRGGPIANSRIKKVEDGKVTFDCGRDKEALMTLPIEKFIRRFLQHVPLPGAMLVRAYGLYSYSKGDELSHCRQILGQEPVEEVESVDWQRCFEDSEEHPELCPVCGKGLVCTGVVPRKGVSSSGVPPPTEVFWDKAA